MNNRQQRRAEQRAKKKQGIQELRYIDSRKIRKVREVIKEKAPNGTDVVKKTVEYFEWRHRNCAARSETPLAVLLPVPVLLLCSARSLQLRSRVSLYYYCSTVLARYRFAREQRRVTIVV